MLALLGFIIALALAIALAPIILGVIGTMLGLFLTAILYVLAGCPSNTPARATTPSHAAPATEQEDPMAQFAAWDREDAERRAKHAADKALRAGKAAARRTRETIDAALLDAQKRVHHAEP